MKFAHLSDTHLGFRQYGIYERESDFYRAFEKAIAAILRERPDFVIHSGDLFDVPRPPPRALWVAQRCFSKLKEKGIPVYAITGNHDMLMRRGAMPPHILYRDMNMRMLTFEEPFILHKGLFIGGVPYTSRHNLSALKEGLAILSEKAGKHRKSVLVMHQGTDRHLKYGHEISSDDIPKGFNYYAMGHVHSRIVEDFGRGKLAYPGSTEFWSLNEYDEYKRKGKGFYMVDMGGDVPDVQPVTIEPEREIIRERIAASDVQGKLSAMVRSLSSLKAKPMLYLEVKEDGFERSAVQEALQSGLSGHVLSLRLSYLRKKQAAGKGTAMGELGLPQIHHILSEMMGSKPKAALASKLFESLSEGNLEQAQDDAETFFEDEVKP